MLLPVMLFMLAISAFGQRSLEIKDVTEGMNVFSGKDKGRELLSLALSIFL